MKQTAVEWYENEINALFDKYDDKEISKSEFMIMKHNLFYPAKEMEKAQIVNAYTSNSMIRTNSKAEKYYNETFKTNEE